MDKSGSLLKDGRLERFRTWGSDRRGRCVLNSVECYLSEDSGAHSVLDNIQPCGEQLKTIAAN